MKKLFYFSLSVCFLWVSAADGASATNQLQELTLEQAIHLAEQQHPELAEAEALVQVAEGQLQQAGKFPNPDAIARMESAPVRGRTAGEAEYVAGISQTIPIGGRLSKAREAERLEREKRLQSLEVKRREIRKRVHGAFATALYQEQARRTLNEILGHAERFAAVVKARVDAGDALPNDLARAEIEVVRAKAERQRSETLYWAALAGLKGAMGNPSLSVSKLSGSADVAMDILTLEELAANIANTPLSSFSQADFRESEARVALAQAQRIPDIRVDLLYRRLQREERNAFDVGVSIPLPLFNRHQGSIQAAKADVKAAEARALTTRLNQEIRLREAHAQLTAALAHSQILKTEIIPRAETARKTAEVRNTAGDLNLSDLLVIQRDWASIHLTYLESLRDVMQAWADLAPFLNR